MAGGRDLRVNLISDLSRFTRGLREGEGELRSFSGRVGTIAAGIGASLLAGFSVAAIKDQIGQAITAASNLNESMSKVGVVFGSSSRDIVDWSKTAAKSMLLSQQAALEAAGTFGNLFQAFGLARDKSAEMSKTLVQLAADLASFNNTSVDDAIEALRSGISGEAEPLKRYGVALTDVRLRAEALAQGIYDGKGALDVAQKAQASYALILKDTALAQGDVKRTSSGFANTMRTISASIEDARAKFGEGLVLAIQDASGALDGPDGLADSIENAGTSAGNFVLGFESGLKDILGLIDKVKGSLPGSGQGFTLIDAYKQVPGLGLVITMTDKLIQSGEDARASMEAAALATEAAGQDAEDTANQHRALAGQMYAAANAADDLDAAGTSAAGGLKKIEVGAVNAKTALQRLQEGLDGIFSSDGSFGKAQEKFQQGIAWSQLLAEGPGKSGSNGTTTKGDYLNYANQIVSQAVATAKTLGPKAANKLLQNAQDRVTKLLSQAGYQDARAQAAALVGPVNINPNPREWENMYRDRPTSRTNVDPSRTATQHRNSTSRANSRSAQRSAKTNARP